MLGAWRLRRQDGSQDRAERIRDGRLAEVEQRLSDVSRERDAFQAEAEQAKAANLALAEEVREIDAALTLLKKDRADAAYWRKLHVAERERFEREHEISMERLNALDEVRAQLRAKDGQIEDQADQIEKLEAGLTGTHEQVRELKRANGALKEQNTRLQLSEVGQLLAKVNEQAKQLAAKENLIARLECREEQAVTP